MLLAVLAMLAACEKPILDDGSVDGGSPGEANVVLHFTQSESGDFFSATRAATHADTPAATRAATRAATAATASTYIRPVAEVSISKE